MKLRTPVSNRDHAIGRPDAPVTLVEYGDYQCPYCRRAFPIMQALHSRLGDQLRLVFLFIEVSGAGPRSEPSTRSTGTGPSSPATRRALQDRRPRRPAARG